jgi:hypothetical protein
VVAPLVIPIPHQPSVIEDYLPLAGPANPPMRYSSWPVPAQRLSKRLTSGPYESCRGFFLRGFFVAYLQFSSHSARVAKGPCSAAAGGTAYESVSSVGACQPGGSSNHQNPDGSRPALNFRISVIKSSSQRPTQFQELARLARPRWLSCGRREQPRCRHLKAMNKSAPSQISAA